MKRLHERNVEDYLLARTLEEATMRLTRQLVVISAAALACISAVRAEEWTSYGPTTNTSIQALASAQVHQLVADPKNETDTVEVLHGRWRPYWRGYYHGSFGYAPRPNLWYGPFVFPPYYAARPVYSPAVVYYSMPCPCPSQVVLTSASPVSPTPSQSNPLPKTPPVSSESFYRYDGGPNSPIPRAGSFRPAETAEPPLAVDSSINRRVNSPKTSNPARYLAYGESLSETKSTTVLVENR
jgi:hypothetical protein